MARIFARILSIQLLSSPERREEFEGSTKSVNAIYHGTEDAFGWLKRRVVALARGARALGCCAMMGRKGLTGHS